jgi:Kef-type K+ transport system membrane component KefB
LVFGILIGNLALLTAAPVSFAPLLDNEVVGILGELGVMILLFQVGLESNVRDMLKVGVSSFLVAVVGVIAPMFLGYFVGRFPVAAAGFNTWLFIGAALTATSVGITARVLKTWAN